MKKTYRVDIYYCGTISFDVEADNEDEAEQIAQKDFDEISDMELIANLNYIGIDGIFECDY